MINLQTIQHFVLPGRAVFLFRIQEEHQDLHWTAVIQTAVCGFSFLHTLIAGTAVLRFLRAWLDWPQRRDSPLCREGPGWAGPARWAPVSSRLWDGCGAAGRTRPRGARYRRWLLRTAIHTRKGQEYGSGKLGRERFQGHPASQHHSDTVLQQPGPEHLPKKRQSHSYRYWHQSRQLGTRTRRVIYVGLDEKWALSSEMDPGTKVGHEAEVGKLTMQKTELPFK